MREMRTDNSHMTEFYIFVLTILSVVRTELYLLTMFSRSSSSSNESEFKVELLITECQSVFPETAYRIKYTRCRVFL